MSRSSFEWDGRKDIANQKKHGVSFLYAVGAFMDVRRILAEDLTHSTAKETRYYCFGNHGGGILTVRFTYRGGVIRIFGAGYWRKGKRIYEQANQIHQGPDRRRKDR
jgi:uncharacterized DUF497 family protein